MCKPDRDAILGNGEKRPLVEITGNIKPNQTLDCEWGEYTKQLKDRKMFSSQCLA